MNKSAMFYLIGLTLVVIPTDIFAQAFGEYGRAVGSVPHGQGITGGKTPGGVSQGGATGGGVGNVDGRALATRLVVAAKSAGLYPRQDGEAEKIDQLSEGESLVPVAATGIWLRHKKGSWAG